MSENAQKLIPVIQIKNFPSLSDVIQDFKLFLTERQSKEKYKIIDRRKSNKIFLYVSNPNTAYKFTEKYNLKIFSNPNYSNSECSLTFKKPERNNLNNNTSFNSAKYMNKREKLNFRSKLKIRPANNVNNHNGININKSASFIGEYERKHWNNIREKANIINNDSPYIDKLYKEYSDKIKDKKKWINSKNFNVFVGKASSIKSSYKYEIKNYVMRTPSLPPILHQFRETQRKKWICSKNFKVY